MDIEDLEICSFLLASIGERNLADIQKHLEICDDCSDELWHSYKNYKKVGPDEDLISLNIQLPEGISSESEFLKSWHFQACSNNEKDESLELSLNKKLKRKDVKNSLKKLRIRQTLMASFVYNKTPSVAIVNQRRLIADSFREIYKLLGHKEFLLFMTDDPGEQENLLEELVSFWENP